MRPVNLVLLGLVLDGAFCSSHKACAQAPTSSGTVITIAGNGLATFAGDGGPATSASLHDPHGMAIGPDGTLYFTDSVNFRIRAVDPVTGIMTTVVGNGTAGDTGNGGPATDATLSGVYHLAVDRARNALYFADLDNNWLRKVDLSTGVLTVYAGQGPNGFGFSGDGGPATLAEFAFPEGVAIDASGRLSITDTFNNRVRQVDPVTGIITTIAGNGGTSTAGDGGPATVASLAGVGIVSSDGAGNVFVTDQSASTRIRRIDAATGIITTVAGGGVSPLGAGSATDVNLANVHAYTAVDDAGRLFFAHGNQVFKVDLTTGQLSLFAGAASSGFSGDGGPALDARFHSIGGLALAPGGGLLISDTVNQRVRYIAPDSIHLVGDAGLTEFHLPWVSALSGDLTVSNNSNLTVINIGSLETIAGNLDLSDNASAGVLDLNSLNSVGGNVNVSGNTAAGVLDFGLIMTITGNLDLSGNSSAGVLDFNALMSVGGNINISGNTVAGVLDFGMLATVTGNLHLSGSLSAGVLDFGSLTSVGGDVNVTGNGPAGALDLGSLTSVGGDLMVETTGSGTFVLSGADVDGDTSITASGYTEVAAATAGGETAVTMFNNEATMEVTLPDGAFSSEVPVTFHIERLPGGGVETVGGEMVTHLETYAFDFAIPTLNSAAELNFEIDLAALDEPDRLSLLGLLHDSAELTIGVRGDAPGAELQLFDVCSGGGPVADSCVVVHWLDEARMLLDPLGNIDPSILRFESLVGHFSTYSVVAVGLAGDYNLDGIVDAADYVVWRKTDGTQAGYDVLARPLRENRPQRRGCRSWLAQRCRRCGPRAGLCNDASGRGGDDRRDAAKMVGFKLAAAGLAYFFFLDRVRLSRSGIVFLPQLRKQPSHRVGMHSQQPSSPALVAPRRAERLLHGYTAQLGKIHEGQRGLVDSPRTGPFGQPGLAIEHVGLFDNVSQLADVAGPAIFAELPQCFAVRSPQRSLVSRRKLSRKVFHEIRNVVHPLPEWRHVEFDHVQAIVQILAEATLGHFQFEIAVRGRDDLHI